MIRIQWIELKSSDGGVLTRKPETLEVPSGCTVQQALTSLGQNPARIAELLGKRAVAVFGMYANENTELFEGDRLEILDELQFDPMESRRRRARHKTLTKRQKELARYERRSRKQAKTHPEN